MQLSLTEKEREFEVEVRAFLAQNLNDKLRRAQTMARGFFVDPPSAREWQAVLHHRGWGAPSWPREFGGPDWTPVQRFIFERECAQAGAPVMQNAGIRMAGPVIMRFGSMRQKEYYLPRMLSGEDYWCQGYSEPGAGSDLASLKLSAVRDGEHYRLNGSKIWTTYAQHADRMFCLVRTASTGREQEGITFLLLDMRAPGMTVRPILSLSGEHELNQVFFDDVRVPLDNVVGEAGKGWTCAKYVLEFERGGSINGPRLRALLRRVIDACSDQSNRRAKAMNDPLLAARISEAEIEVETFEFTELQMLSAMRVGNAPGPISSLLRLRGSQIRQLIQRLAVDLLGEGALVVQIASSNDTGEADARFLDEVQTLMAQHLNGRAYTIVGGTSEIQHEVMAKGWLKL